jgi:PPM family protein phosphatase
MTDVQGLYLVTAIVLAALVLWVAWVSWRAPVAVLESQPTTARTPRMPEPASQPSSAPTPQAAEPASPVAPSATPESAQNGPDAKSADAKNAEAAVEMRFAPESDSRARMKTILGLASPSATPPPVEVKPVVVLPAKRPLNLHLEIQDSASGESVVVAPDEGARGERGPSNTLAVAVGRSEPASGRSSELHSIDPRHHMFIFADGAGRKVGPTLASAIAVHEVIEAFEKDEVSAFAIDPKLTVKVNRLRRAVLTANRSLLQQARAAGYAGLGTSIFTAHFSPTNDEVSIAHVGANRAYRVRGGKITRLTMPPGVRLLGVSEKVEVEVAMDAALPKDLYLFCSDGLGRALADGDLLEILKTESSLTEISQTLIDRAKGKGSDTQDLVAIVVRVDPSTPAPRSSGRAKTVMGLG